ncbi:nitrate/nitrite two-component system sensor histidine kinase NarX, partial [Klebsiella pneumoniae]|nr:nitrate/nitrite two-component system sensor histidine kinase NarX [Klebsiella pneumoniae]
MNSSRVMAELPLNETANNQVDDMHANVFSPALQNSARRDRQEIQLKALHQYWQLAPAPRLQRPLTPPHPPQAVAH